MAPQPGVVGEWRGSCWSSIVFFPGCCSLVARIRDSVASQFPRISTLKQITSIRRYFFFFSPIRDVIFHRFVSRSLDKTISMLFCIYFFCRHAQEGTRVTGEFLFSKRNVAFLWSFLTRRRPPLKGPRTYSWTGQKRGSVVGKIREKRGMKPEKFFHTVRTFPVSRYFNRSPSHGLLLNL